LEFGVWDVGCGVPGFGFQVLGTRFRISGFGFRVPGFGFRVSGFRSQVSGLEFRVSGFGFGRKVANTEPLTRFQVSGRNWQALVSMLVRMSVGLVTCCISFASGLRVS
jgi:hypothetical protein